MSSRQLSPIMNRLLFREDRVIVFDTETVPDLYAARHLLGLDASTPSLEIRRLLGRLYAREGEVPDTCFVKPVMHRIVALSALELVRLSNLDPWSVGFSHQLHVGDLREPVLLRAFDSWLETSPRLAGFNISGFDLPLLRMRALALGVPMLHLSGRAGRDYWYRFGRDRIDLCDLLSNFGSMPRPSLAEATALFGVRAKATTSGADVEELAAEHRYADISSYCMRDVVATAHLFLRWELATDKLSVDAYQSSHKSLVNRSRAIRLHGGVINADSPDSRQ